MQTVLIFSISIIAMTRVPYEFGDIEKAVCDFPDKLSFWVLLDRDGIGDVMDVLAEPDKHYYEIFGSKGDPFSESGCIRLRTTTGRWTRISWYSLFNVVDYSIKGDLCRLNWEDPRKPRFEEVIANRSTIAIPFAIPLISRQSKVKFVYPRGHNTAPVESIIIERLQLEMPTFYEIADADYAAVVKLLHAPKQTAFEKPVVIIDEGVELDTPWYIPKNDYPQFWDDEKLSLLIKTDDGLRYRFCFFDLGEGLLGMTIRGYRLVFSKSDSSVLEAIFARAKPVSMKAS